ncbi:uncharacterized protein [Musca autumnalis]|uniref:uncharacterized protein n=1 Tax=Musca autumnalis TaxID=221902 RepID=UPI003CF4599A
MEEALINAVQQHTCIYDKSSKAYRNKFSKEKAWDAVANAVGKPVKQCQTRWKSLRDRFVKEELKLASGSEAPEYMDWKFSASMSFLRNLLQPRPFSFYIGFTKIIFQTNQLWSQGSNIVVVPDFLRDLLTRVYMGFPTIGSRHEQIPSSDKNCSTGKFSDDPL